MIRETKLQKQDRRRTDILVLLRQQMSETIATKPQDDTEEIVIRTTQLWYDFIDELLRRE